MSTALVHDYLTQRGGAERVALLMTKAFPEASLHTSLYEPELTFPEFRDVTVVPLWTNSLAYLRRDHRRALPLLAPAFSMLRVHAEVVLCSSSGWAHGVHADGRKVVYCHNVARWLYQPDVYVHPANRLRRLAVALLRPLLVTWDRRRAVSADRYLANSTATKHRIQATYGIDSEVLHPPPGLGPSGDRVPVERIEPGYLLCVSRLLGYKNVAQVVRSFERVPSYRLVVVGDGPDAAGLRALAGSNVRFVGTAADSALRWLYANCRGVVAASFEDFGLTPLEAAAFGKPTAALRWGGFLDTVVEGETGVFFEEPEEGEIVAAVTRLLRAPWDSDAIMAHAERFSEQRFIKRLTEIVSEERVLASV